jgi:hypothetical protein
MNIYAVAFLVLTQLSTYQTIWYCTETIFFSVRGLRGGLRPQLPKGSQILLRISKFCNSSILLCNGIVSNLDGAHRRDVWNSENGLGKNYRNAPNLIYQPTL